MTILHLWWWLMLCAWVGLWLVPVLVDVVAVVRECRARLVERRRVRRVIDGYQIGVSCGASSEEDRPSVAHVREAA